MCDRGTTVWHRDTVGVYSDAETHGDADADARLIAAAPELLEALKYCVEALPSADKLTTGTQAKQDAAAAKARAAIAKATGAV